MSLRRTPASTLASVVLTVAVSVLGFRLFLPGASASCADAGAACCCNGGSSDAPEGSEAGGCGCSLSPATPVPAAVLAPIDGVPPPMLVAQAAEDRTGDLRVAAADGPRPVPRARSAPTQAILETFRN